MSSEDICVWPDGTWCYRYELDEYSFLSDDYIIYFVDTPEYERWSNENF